MADLKAVVRGMLITAAWAAAAPAGSMLVLGVSSGNNAVPQGPTSSSYSFSSFDPFASAPALRLGMSNAPAASAYSPAPAAPSYSPAPVAQSNPAHAPIQQAPAAAAPVFMAAPMAAAPAPAPAPAPSSGGYDALINLGTGPFPNAAGLTTGNPQAWYLSAPVERLFGGVPNASQQASFDGTVLQRVQQSFNQSGVPVSLTIDPTAQAAHTLSVVSQAINPNLNSAIGMTYLGGNGFHYIDNSANAAQNVDQLEWIVAHNVSHELMLAFNVPEVHDTTGHYIDARNASWSMITNPNATFSPGAVADLLSKNFQDVNQSVLYPGAQVIGSPNVPEPTTVLLWVGLGSVGFVAHRRARKVA